MKKTVRVSLKALDTLSRASYRAPSGKEYSAESATQSEAFALLAKWLAHERPELLNDAPRSGREPLENRWVLFIDLLGFSAVQCDLVSTDPNRKARATTALDGMMAFLNLDLDRAFVEGHLGLFDPWPDLMVSSFSDSIIATASDENGAAATLLHLAGSFCERALGSARLLTRGALTYGPTLHLDNVVLGPALIEAVRLEEETVVPRIALSTVAREQIQANMPSWQIDVEGGAAFCDVFTHIINRHRTWADPVGEDAQAAKLKWTRETLVPIVESLRTLWSEHADSEPKIRRKYEWLIERYNVSIGSGPLEGLLEPLALCPTPKPR